MKLKHYLIVSCLLILVAPLLCCTIIFKLNRDYNYRTELKDFMATSAEFAKYEEIVSDPQLYTDKKIPNELKRIGADNDVVITLYNNQGITLFSTITDNEYMIPQEYLYKNLNEIQYGGSTYTLKKPVFNNDSNVIGFYEISLARDNLRESLNKNMLMSVLSFVVILIGIFLIVLRYLNRRFNTPLKIVIQGMNDYAKGDTNVHIDYESKDEIGELCEHFNTMKDDVEKSKRAIVEEQKAKEYMIATISHDLKTPLTAVRAYTEMLQIEDEIDKEKEKEYLDIILSKCDYMRDMLDDLLTYNLLSMNYNLSLVEVEGEEFCEMLFAGMEATCKKKSIELETTIDVNGTYNVDVKYMTRVIDNIVSNAVRHTPVGGCIWTGAFSTDVKFPEWLDDTCKDVLMRYPKPGMFLLVMNEGNVISTKDKENLFKPFYQGDEARCKKEHKGVGLGLSISKMIMEKHQGSIEAIPIKGVGNAMVCFLRDASYKEDK